MSNPEPNDRGPGDALNEPIAAPPECAEARPEETSLPAPQTGTASATPFPPETNTAGGAEPPLVRPAAASNVPPVAGPTVHPFRFHGRANEYFRIWIVNTLLTLLTLGVFFPWAKVRKRRYLRGSTELFGHRFDYRADPVRLLVGHVLMAVLFLGYSVFGVVYPVIRYGVLALALVLLPWIVVRSLAFNAHNTVYRGLRFRFHPSLSSAAGVFMGQGLLVVLTLGLYYPAWVRRKREYLVTSHRFGDAYFHLNAGAGRFYRAYLLGGGVAFVVIFLAAVVLGMYASLNPGRQPGPAVLVPFFVVYGLGIFLGKHLIHPRLFNHVWNNTSLDEHRFVASMDSGRWLGLQFTNLCAIVASLGLLYPWAVMRTNRYTAECLGVLTSGPVESIQRLESSAGSATSDSAAELIGMDFGL